MGSEMCIRDRTNFVANFVDLEGVLACAGLFCPTFIEIDNVLMNIF